MNRQNFAGFSPTLFQFFRDLAANNNKVWFDEHRQTYQAQVLEVMKAFVTDFAPIMQMLNDDFETEPRVGRTISRINNDIRFHKNRPTYRPFMYVSFPRRHTKWSSEALLYVGIYSHGVGVGFYPGGYRKLRKAPLQENIRQNPRLFQRYLKERQIAEKYFELTDGESTEVQKWPLPKTARRWVNLESFSVGEYFKADEVIRMKRKFLDRAQAILLDVYPLWLFAMSENVKDDFALYEENVELLARPLTRSA
ncbi:MAG: DUF2461 family protein [Acidobacteria bacterium]|nr:DUF2461 family protein [Acidobacteriota bacterium]